MASHKDDRRSGKGTADQAGATRVSAAPPGRTDAPARANAMWGGRFANRPDAVMEAINASIDVDRRMALQDIAGSRAHVAMLAARDIVTTDDRDAILDGLARVEEEIESGSFPYSKALEDIHMNVEARLRDHVGPAAGRLHTARSRNDQVALDFRLWTRDAIDRTSAQIDALMDALIGKAETHAQTVMPGFTHLQSAQPVTFGHHMMAYVEMLVRDRGRFTDCRERLNESPLGAAALAGTSFPIDRHATAEALGFAAPARNSLDAVSARDFALEFMSACAILATHLSRLAEEIVIWSTPQFGFVSLSDAFSTGSSIMPQKRNPDAAELVRAKTGRTVGALVALLTVMKGLPLAYSKDMQEDKERLFDAADTTELSLAAMTGMISDMDVDADAMARAAGAGFATATDLADWLVRERDLPFREAHHVTGRAVALAEEKKCDLADLTLDDLRSIHDEIDDTVFEVLSVEASVASRTSFGGTAPQQVREQVAYRRRWLEETRSR